LFADRATAAGPGFALTDDNAPCVAAICRRLDGLPLAVELAAARTRLHTPSSILTRLDNPFRLLTDESPIAPPHPTLPAAIPWSAAPLPPPHPAPSRRLAAFPAGFTLDAAEAVCESDELRASSFELESLLPGESLPRRTDLEARSSKLAPLDLVSSLLDHNL